MCLQNGESVRYEELTIEGRNAVIEAFRAGKTIDKVFILDGCHDGPINTITREARKHNTIISYVVKERLDQMSHTGKHQGVIAIAAAYEYATVEDILDNAKEKGEAPFIFILDNIEDPHNLGAIIRTCEAAGVSGIIIPKDRSVLVNATVIKVSTGATSNMKIARVTNIVKTIEEMKKDGFWIVGSDMNGTSYDEIDYRGKTAIVIGNEGSGMSRLVRESCDFIASIPMIGTTNSLNASVATGILIYEALRKRK